MTGLPSSFQTIDLGLANEEFWNVPLEKDFKKVEEFTTLDDYKNYLETQVASGFDFDRANELWSETTDTYGQTKDGQIVKYQDLPSDEEFEKVAQQQKSIFTAQRGLPIGSQDLTNLTEAGFTYYQPESEEERQAILNTLSGENYIYSGNIPNNYLRTKDSYGNYAVSKDYTTSGFNTHKELFDIIEDPNKPYMQGDPTAAEPWIVTGKLPYKSLVLK